MTRPEGKQGRLALAWRGILSCGLAVAAGAAQDLVVPAGAGVAGDLTRREGNDSFHLPARYAPSRVLTVYRGADLGIGRNGKRIASVRFRRDGLKTTKYSPHRWRLTVDVSSVGVIIPSSVRATSFDLAHGQDRVRVLDRKHVDWPAEQRPQNPPALFSVQVKLDRPYLLLPGRNLCVDLRSDTESGKRETFYWYVDAERFYRSGFAGSGRLLGRGCPFGFQTRVRVPPLDGESRIETWSYTRFGSAGSTWAFLVVGSGKTAWGQQKLPFDLPGASGCRLYTNPVFVQPARTIANDARGLVRFWSSPLPRATALHGFVFYEQVLVQDPGSNALGLRSSNYVEVHLGRVSDPLPARLLYHSGPDPKDVPTAAVDAGIVLALGS